MCQSNVSMLVCDTLLMKEHVQPLSACNCIQLNSHLQVATHEFYCWSYVSFDRDDNIHRIVRMHVSHIHLLEPLQLLDCRETQLRSVKCK